MAFLGLSLVTWQTLLIISFPLIYGSFSRIKRILIFIRNPLKRSAPQDDKTESSAGSKRSIRQLLNTSTLLLGSMIGVMLLHFLMTNPAQTNPFTLTKHQLNIPSTTLATALTRYYRTKGRTDMPVEQERLLKKLNTLDARLLYATLGPDAFLNCIWCRPPSSKTNGTDHLLYTLVRLGFQHAAVLVLLGIMTTGGSHVAAKRRVWRARLALLGALWYLLEACLLTMLVFVPGLLPTMDGGRMVWDALFVARSWLSSLLLLGGWWALNTEPAYKEVSPLAQLGLGMSAVAAKLDSLINRLRLSALQRSALMRDPQFRAQIIQFWEHAQSQAKLAGSNQAVKTLKDTMGLSEKQGENRAQFAQWIDHVYPAPTVTPAPNQPSSQPS